MKIGVCIKVTPHVDARLKISSDAIDTTGEKLVVSDWDEFAVEEAIRTKEAAGGEVVAFNVGPHSNDKVLRAGALALGADKAVIIDAPLTDSLGIAQLLADKIREEGCDIVFTGKATTDDGSGQIGPMLAELLGWVQVTQIQSFELDGTSFKATRHMDAGVRQTVTGSLPAVITCEDGLNTPRYAKLPAIMKAKKKPLDKLESANPGGNRSTLTNFAPPPSRPAGRILEGDAATTAKELVRLLRDEAKVI